SVTPNESEMRSLEATSGFDAALIDVLASIAQPDPSTASVAGSTKLMVFFMVTDIFNFLP
ncbi:MAG: hypothetical protein AAB425_13950, partial [Bdellovibrionota bacterium]